MKKTFPIFSYAALCMAVLVILPATRLESSSADFPTVRQIQYGFSLRNTTNRVLRHIEFWTYAPVPKNSIQMRLNLEASYPYRLLTDGMGNHVLHFSLADLPPYGTRILSISALVSFSDRSSAIPLEDPNPYIVPEEYIESDNPDIRRVAAGLIDTSLATTAERIFRWVSEHIQSYEYSGKDRGALFALRNRRGDCSEAMHLFVALCRAAGIPARGIGGYVHGSSTILDPEAYHHWAEFHTDGAWHVADPQRKVFCEEQHRYCAMRIIGRTTGNPLGNYHRFRFIGDGLEVLMRRG